MSAGKSITKKCRKNKADSNEFRQIIHLMFSNWFDKNFKRNILNKNIRFSIKFINERISCFKALNVCRY